VSEFFVYSLLLQLDMFFEGGYVASFMADQLRDLLREEGTIFEDTGKLFVMGGKSTHFAIVPKPE
jgi:hypothetical protein